MIKIGITGQNGFIGRHLYNYLSLIDDIELIPFERSFFESENLLKEFVSKLSLIHI